jgi:hypothetical protein
MANPARPSSPAGDTPPAPGDAASHAGGAGRNDVTRDVEAPPEAVFAVLSNGWLYPTWVVGAARMRAVDDRWPAVGAKLHHSFGSWPVMLDDETEVLVSEPARRLVLQAHGWPAGEATVDLRIEPLPGGRSRVVLGEDASRGPGRFIPSIVRTLVMRVRNRETLRRLAFIAEGQPR